MDFVDVVNLIIDTIRSAFDFLRNTELVGGFTAFDVIVDSAVLFALEELLFGSSDGGD